MYYSARWAEIITSGWIVLEITGSPFMVGLTGFFRVLADRFRRVNILIGIHAVSLLAALSLAAAFMLGSASLWMIYPYQQLIAIVADEILSVGPFWMGSSLALMEPAAR